MIKIRKELRYTSD